MTDTLNARVTVKFLRQAQKLCAKKKLLVRYVNFNYFISADNILCQHEENELYVRTFLR